MNRWHQHYLRGDYHNQDPKALYQARLATVQEALDLIEDGDCLAWSTHGSEPKVFLEHLHTIAPRLDKGVDCWNTITRYTYPVTSDPGLAGKFRHHTFFFDKWSEGAGCTTISRWTSTCMPREFRPARPPTSLWPRCRQWTSTAMSI